MANWTWISNVPLQPKKPAVSWATSEVCSAGQSGPALYSALMRPHPEYWMLMCIWSGVLRKKESESLFSSVLFHHKICKNWSYHTIIKNKLELLGMRRPGLWGTQSLATLVYLNNAFFFYGKFLWALKCNKGWTKSTFSISKNEECTFSI